MSKGVIGFLGGCLAGAALVMLYLHREAITACIKGEELPEAPEGCPFSKAEPCCEPKEPVCEQEEPVSEQKEPVCEPKEETGDQ